jgi:hypothetical protein
MRERDIERHLVKRVKELGGEVRKVQWVGRNGAPDRLVMLPDRKHHTRDICGIPTPFYQPASSTWVELKAPGKVPTAQQVREHQRMRAMGQHVVVIDSIEGVEDLLA